MLKQARDGLRFARSKAAIRNPASEVWSGCMDARWFFLLSLTATAPGPPRLAPADEYFGRAQMSPIEITTRIHDAERRGAAYESLLNVQDAIEEWARLYPADPWIPPREYRMSHLFVRLHSGQGTTGAARCRALLEANFGGNRYALAAQREAKAARVVAKTAPKASASPKPVAKKAARKRHRFLGIVF
jgi:hypothetical protein